MLIGNNNNLGSKSSKLLNNLKSQHSNHASHNNFGFAEDLSNYSHTNANDEIAMYDKSLAMLKERYENKLISADEFNKKCKEIGKKKSRALKNQNRNK